MEANIYNQNLCFKEEENIANQQNIPFPCLFKAFSWFVEIKQPLRLVLPSRDLGAGEILLLTKHFLSIQRTSPSSSSQYHKICSVVQIKKKKNKNPFKYYLSTRIRKSYSVVSLLMTLLYLDFSRISLTMPLTWNCEVNYHLDVLCITFNSLAWIFFSFVQKEYDIVYRKSYIAYHRQFIQVGKRVKMYDYFLYKLLLWDEKDKHNNKLNIIIQ